MSDASDGGRPRTFGPVEAPPDGPGRLERTPLHRGRILDVSLDRVRFPDGSEGEMEMVAHSGAAAVLPWMGDRDDRDADVLLVRQYRYASGGELYEVPAGMPDGPDESWETCARRELEEETGWRAGRLARMTRILTSPGFCDEVIHLFLGWELTPGEERLDVDEFVEVVQVPFSQAVSMVQAGEIVDCKSVAAILYARAFALGG